MSKRRHYASTPATKPTDAAARWKACPFSPALDQLAETLATYRSMVEDIGHDAHGSIMAPRLVRLYDAIDRAAFEIGNSPNEATEVWPDARTIDDVWVALGETL